MTPAASNSPPSPGRHSAATTRSEPAPPRRRSRLQRGRLVVGLAVTLAVIGLDAVARTGVGDPLAWLNHPIQDGWSRWPWMSGRKWMDAARPGSAASEASSGPNGEAAEAAPPESPVAIVAIDEGAIERVGRWPWDRIRLAQLIDELRLAGVRTIALDVLLESEQPPRWTTDPMTLEPLERVHDDEALEEAIRAHGNVVLAMNVSPADAEEREETRPAGKGAADAQATPEAAATSRSTASASADPLLPSGLAISPVASFASAAARLADVNITGRHDPDAVLREIPIWAEAEGRLWPTLGLAAALAHEQIPVGEVAIDSAGGVSARDLFLLARRGRGDANRHLVTYPRAAAHWEKALAERAILSAGWVLDPALAEEAARRAVHAADRMVQSASAEPFNLIEPDESYAEAIGALKREPVTSAAFAAALQAVLPLWERLSEDARAYLELFEGEPADEQEQLFHRGLLAFANDLPAIAGQLQGTPDLITSRRAEIREMLAGKLVFIGWLETGAAVDVVATPIHPKTPGVIVHATVASSILTGHQRRDPPLWLDPVATLVAGLIGTLIAARLGVLLSPLLTLATCAAAAALEGAFLWNDALLAVSPAAPILAASLSWMSVTLYRLLVEQRARARTEARFKRYVSPEVVDILVANPAMNTMTPEQRTLTILFADLENFTALAEALGPRQTGRLLNDCLSRYTDVLLASSATLDKYLGDGLMAFWGAPIETPDHARRAVLAALAMQKAQQDMNISSALRGGLLGAPTPSTALRLRIGIATGEVMVGDFGAPPVRSGYTVIGDAVNLASRLEQANRLLGTGVLLDARTADAVRGDVLLRPLGRLRLRGRGEPESIYEPLCPLAEATDADRKRAEAARELAEAFARADFPAALAAAAKVEEDPRDRALAGLYRAEIARWQAAAGGAAATAPAAGTDTPSPSAGEAPRLPAPEGFDATLSLTDSKPLGNAHPK